MDHIARCGMTTTTEFSATPGMRQETQCALEGDSDAFFDGYVGLPGSITIEGDALGGGATFPFPGALAYATDPVGAFSIEGDFLLTINNIPNVGQGGGGSGGTSTGIFSGFGFYFEGLLTDNELVTIVIFSVDVMFTETSPAVFKAKVAPASDAVFRLTTVDDMGFENDVGYIAFESGMTVGVLVWVSPPFVLSSGDMLSLYAPSPPDSALAFISGYLDGTPT